MFPWERKGLGLTSQINNRQWQCIVQTPKGLWIGPVCKCYVPSTDHNLALSPRTLISVLEAHRWFHRSVISGPQSRIYRLFISLQSLTSHFCLSFLHYRPSFPDQSGLFVKTVLMQSGSCHIKDLTLWTEILKAFFFILEVLNALKKNITLSFIGWTETKVTLDKLEKLISWL